MQEYTIGKTGVKMRYFDLPGDEMPILFVHGLGCGGSFDYPRLASQKCLAGHRRILADLPGAGYSDKPEGFDYSVRAHASYLKGLMEDVVGEKFILYGHSLGGAVAIELAAMCPDMIDRLIICESNIDPSGDDSWSKGIADQDKARYISRGHMELVGREMCRGNTLWAASLKNWLPEAAWKISKNAAKGGDPSWRDMLYALPMPKYSIFGEKSLPDYDEQELRKHDITVKIVPGVGHFMACEDPASTAAVIAECLFC